MQYSKNMWTASCTWLTDLSATMLGWLTNLQRNTTRAPTTHTMLDDVHKADEPQNRRLSHNIGAHPNLQERTNRPKRLGVARILRMAVTLVGL